MAKTHTYGETDNSMAKFKRSEQMEMQWQKFNVGTNNITKTLTRREKMATIWPKQIYIGRN